MKPLSLYELNNLVRTALSQGLADDYWLQAEISDLRIHATGHCYLEFVQKSSGSNALVAKARGVIWGAVFRLLRPYFERETGQLFTSGIRVLVKVNVEFHELYGYSLSVIDIDPTYTVGDMARRRREIILQLEAEGVLTLNKELLMPPIPLRVAVISSVNAAGYGDFCDQLLSNPYGYHFSSQLFPATMQGELVESSILKALDDILSSSLSWDVVVIIRGGGAVSDLSGFDTYLLAASCAQYPLPIITGIGHERDDTLVDIVAHTRVKTPTAAADFLINRVHESAIRLDNFVDRLHLSVNRYVKEGLQCINDIAVRIPNLIVSRRMREEHNLNILWHQLMAKTVSALESHRHCLKLLEQRVDGANPKQVLLRGFSITLKNGHAITDAAQLIPGESVVIRFAHGEATANIERSFPENSNK